MTNPDAPALPAVEALKHLKAFCEQVANDGILPSRAWFKESAEELEAVIAAIPQQARQPYPGEIDQYYQEQHRLADAIASPPHREETQKKS